MSAPCAQLGLAAAPSCCPQMSKEPSQGTARRLPSNLINGTEPCVGVRARCCALLELPRAPFGGRPRPLLPMPEGGGELAGAAPGMS